MISSEYGIVYEKVLQYETNVQNQCFLNFYKQEIKKQIKHYQQYLTNSRDNYKQIKTEYQEPQNQSIGIKQQKIQEPPINDVIKTKNSKKLRKTQKMKHKIRSQFQSLEKETLELVHQQPQQKQIDKGLPKQNREEFNIQKISIEHIIRQQEELRKQNQPFILLDGNSEKNDDIKEIDEIVIFEDYYQEVKKKKEKTVKYEQCQNQISDSTPTPIVKMLPSFPKETIRTNQYGDIAQSKQTDDNFNKKEQPKQQIKQVQKQIEKKIQPSQTIVSSEVKNKAKQRETKKNPTVLENNDLDLDDQHLAEPNIPKKPIQQIENKGNQPNAQIKLYEYKNQSQNQSSKEYDIDSQLQQRVPVTEYLSIDNYLYQNVVHQGARIQDDKSGQNNQNINCDPKDLNNTKVINLNSEKQDQQNQLQEPNKTIPIQKIPVIHPLLQKPQVCNSGQIEIQKVILNNDLIPSSFDINNEMMGKDNLKNESILKASHISTINNYQQTQQEPSLEKILEQIRPPVEQFQTPLTQENQQNLNNLVGVKNIKQQNIHPLFVKVEEPQQKVQISNDVQQPLLEPLEKQIEQSEKVCFNNNFSDQNLQEKNKDIIPVIDLIYISADEEEIESGEYIEEKERPIFPIITKNIEQPIEAQKPLIYEPQIMVTCKEIKLIPLTQQNQIESEKEIDITLEEQKVDKQPKISFFNINLKIEESIILQLSFCKVAKIVKTPYL